jgi:site-specific DNA recombinase
MDSPTSPQRAAIYLRVSSEEQRDRETILTQRNFAERYCALHEIVPVGWYADDGVSGTIAVNQRPEGARLLQDARDGRLSVVYVYRVDRIGRVALHVLQAVKTLEECGVRVASMTEPFDTSTPAGRLMLNMLSSFADFERASILEKTLEGTNRHAREGEWVGGIVPFGYRLQAARLAICESTIAGTDLAEAEIVRRVYLRTVEDRWTCQQIAEELNALGVPANAGAGEPGKRAKGTAAAWTGSRVRNLLANTTYMGLHRYGVHSEKSGRELIERDVPAIVSAETWDAAQAVMRTHRQWSDRNRRRDYLLRGLITCGVCGLSFIGHADTRDGSVYYRCGARNQARGIYGAQGLRCPSKAVKGAPLEAAVWRDVEHFIRNPGEALDELAARLGTTSDQADLLRADLARFQRELSAKQGEKDSVITQFRRGRISEGDLDRQLDQVQAEEADLQQRIAAVQQALRDGQRTQESLQGAEALLTELNHEMDGPQTFEGKRAKIAKLVESIRIDVVEVNGKRRAKAFVAYRFRPVAQPLAVTRSDLRTDRG